MSYLISNKILCTKKLSDGKTSASLSNSTTTNIICPYLTVCDSLSNGTHELTTSSVVEYVQSQNKKQKRGVTQDKINISQVSLSYQLEDGEETEDQNPKSYYFEDATCIYPRQIEGLSSDLPGANIFAVSITDDAMTSISLRRISYDDFLGFFINAYEHFYYQCLNKFESETNTTDLKQQKFIFSDSNGNVILSAVRKNINYSTQDSIQIKFRNGLFTFN